jgi:3-phosphoshikimate 1-carboxyvinyltransferase
MDIKIISGVKGGCVDAVASKSYAHRLIICAALADSPTKIICNTTSQDIEATLACVGALGALVERGDGFFTVTPICRENLPENAILDCGESGSTLRFMLPLVCALVANGKMRLHGRLPSRPMSELEEVLSGNGCKLSGIGSDEISFSGKLSGGEFKVAANISSQYITGMLLAMSCLDNDSILTLEGEVVSGGYIDITLDALCAFGIEVEDREDGFFIRGGQKIHSPGEIRVEGDWSNSATWLCCGALSKKGISVKGLNTESSQGDSAISNILAYFGASVKYKSDKVTASKGQLYSIEIDAEGIPDLVPVIATVASVCEGDTVIHGISRLRAKESDRVSSVTKMLCALGAHATADEETMTVRGVNSLLGGEVDSQNDHRIVMAACVAATKCTSEIVIHQAEAINKSYPGFWEDFAALGGIYEVCGG